MKATLGTTLDRHRAPEKLHRVDDARVRLRVTLVEGDVEVWVQEGKVHLRAVSGIVSVEPVGANEIAVRTRVQ